MQIKEIWEIMKIKDFQDAKNLRFSCITGKTTEEIKKMLDRTDVIELRLTEK